MPLKLVFSKPQNWSRLKPFYSSTIIAVKILFFHAYSSKKSLFPGDFGVSESLQDL